MDITYTKEQEEYRLKARKWIKDNLPANVNNDIPRDFDVIANIKLQWEKKLYKGGYAGITWPKKYGGQGEDSVKQIIFNEECGKAGAPVGLNVIGTNILGPTLLELGTEEQKKRFIPKILSGKEVWCQGFSEPNAGSDLASLSTRAELKNNKWIINGQKIWTSWAQFANYCILLARTDHAASKHKGITFFLVPMNAEGITVKPLVQMGDEREFSEVFFDDVMIDRDLVLGEVNEGWKVAMRALSHERGTNALGKQARFYREFIDLVKLSKTLHASDGTPVTKSSYFRQKLAKNYIEVEVLKFLGLKIVNKLINKQKINSDASLQKLYWSEYHKRFGELAMELMSKDSLFWKEDGLLSGKFQDIFIHSRAETIFAGTSEIQKNIIAERILGMPR